MWELGFDLRKQQIKGQYREKLSSWSNFLHQFDIKLNSPFKKKICHRQLLAHLQQQQNIKFPRFDI